MTSRTANKAESVGKVGALLVLACCFLASAALRAGDVVAALPGIDDGYGNPVATPDASKMTGGTPDPVAEPGTLLAELKKRQDLVEQRERALDVREQTLKAVEDRLKERLEEVGRATRQLRDTAARVDDAAEKDVRRLAEMYQQMKPKLAGKIFDQMAPSFAAGFLMEMREDSAALIMSNMNPEKAYAVSILMANRNIKRQMSQGKTE